MVRTSVSTTFDYSIPIEQQLPLISKAGFTHVSIGMEYDHSGLLDEERLKSLADSIRETGLLVDTVHGYDLDQDDAVEINEKVAYAATVLGAPIVVVHCSAFWFPDDSYEEKYRIVSGKIKDIERIAEKYGIRFAFENVVPGKPTQLCEEMVRLGDPKYIGFCFDSSHDQIDGPRPMTLLKDLSDRLLAVHISDRIREFVDHVLPGEGFINFDLLVPLLKESPFKGPLLLEVEVTHSKYKEADDFLARAHASAIDLATRCGWE